MGTPIELIPYLFVKRCHFSSAAVLVRYISKIIPSVNQLLREWELKACLCCNPELRLHALNSIRFKAFHCYGGAVYAILDKERENTLIRLIVAYQTLCDYLDNLCDRAGSTDGHAFRLLHKSLINALTPREEVVDYYRLYSLQGDGGYINKLIDECHNCISKLAGYNVVHPFVLELVEWYIELQVRKHINVDKREEYLQQWAAEKLKESPQIMWQEYAAASGSTLAVFCLLGLAANRHVNQEDCREVVNSYFPWICGLHILLDYLIDRQEDLEGGDLNFTFYYQDQEEMINRLKYYTVNSYLQAALLPEPSFHQTIVSGLLAMYLTDYKVKQQGMEKLAEELIAQGGPHCRFICRLCRIVRRLKGMY